MKSTRIFKVNPKVLGTLTQNEKILLPILISAAKGIDNIYELQENHFNNGANFYPRDAIKDEILKAANSKLFQQNLFNGLCPELF